MEGGVGGLETGGAGGLHIDGLEIDEGDIDLPLGLLVIADGVLLEAGVSAGVVGGLDRGGVTGLVGGGSGGAALVAATGVGVVLGPAAGQTEGADLDKEKRFIQTRLQTTYPYR